MKRRFGVILLDYTEVIFRIYEANGKEWKLLHYHNASLEQNINTNGLEATAIMETVAEFLTTEYAQHISDWKTCSRHLPKSLITELTTALGFPIENITLLREQELLCKGMFTELW